MHKGEIVGLAGLVGAGRSEVARCLFGIDKIAGGTVSKAGTPIQINHPSQAMSHGIGLVPESRKEQGAILVRPIRENMTLSNLKAVSGWMGFIRRRQERETSQKLQQKLAIKLGSVEDPIASLSGGNQQKVVIAKWLNTDCHILILDEPTRGVDVGAKAEIYNIIHQLAERGYSILVISSEMVEVINLCHRIYVMSEGRITKELQHDEISEENIMRYAIPKRETI